MKANRMRDHLEALRKMCRESLTVDVIASALESVRGSDSAATARELMEDESFDVLGVFDERAGSNMVVGYIEREGPDEGVCRDYVKDIKPEVIVPFDAPLTECMNLVCENKRLFVHGADGIEGIVTVADLQKQPVRLFLFGTISMLEMAMTEWIRKEYPGDSWKGLPCKRYVREAENWHGKRRDADQELDLVDCLCLHGKGQVITKRGEMWSALGFQSKAEAEGFFKDAKDLRDNLAHGHDPTQGVDEAEQKDWRDVVRLGKRADEVSETLISKLE